MKAAGRILLIGLVVLSIGAISVWALGAGAGRSILGRHHGDGICDSQGSNCRYEDADNDGVCDSQGSNCRYADADNDGIWDNQGGNCQKETGASRGGAGGARRGHGR